MIQTGSRIVSYEEIAQDRWRMTLRVPRIAAEVIPGQFINVKIEKPNAPLLDVLSASSGVFHCAERFPESRSCIKLWAPVLR
jgi:ferredoxin-NADP reductase